MKTDGSLWNSMKTPKKRWNIYLENMKTYQHLWTSIKKTWKPGKKKHENPRKPVVFCLISDAPQANAFVGPPWPTTALGDGPCPRPGIWRMSSTWWWPPTTVTWLWLWVKKMPSLGVGMGQKDLKKPWAGSIFPFTIIVFFFFWYPFLTHNHLGDLDVSKSRVWLADYNVEV